MGMIFKALFSISAAGQGNNKKTKGYSYDASVSLSPPIKGQHPLLGNGPESLSSKAIQAAKAQRNIKRQITASAGSTTESSTTYIHDTPQILHKIETQSTKSSSLKNWRLDHSSSSWERDTKCSRPTTSTSFVSSTVQRPKTGYIPVSSQKNLRHLDSLPNESNIVPRPYHVDLLDAHSSIHPSETLIRDRVQASGIRSYGEDVADRNMQPELPELPVERIESPQGSRPLIDSPELKFLKEMHLANKRAIGMSENESFRISTPPTSKSENEKSRRYDNQTKKLSHPHSHPLRSLLSVSNKAYQSDEICTVFDRTRSHSLSKLSQPKSLPCTHSNNEATLKHNILLLKNLDSSVSSHNRVYSSPNPSKAHSTLGSKENLDCQKKYHKSRRHTYSTVVSRRIPSYPDERSLSFRQNSQPTPTSNSYATKKPYLKLNNTCLQNITHELNQNDSREKVRDDDKRADSKITEKYQTAINKKHNLKTDDALERNNSDSSEPNYCDNGRRRCSLKQDSIKITPKHHLPFINTNKLESKGDEVLSPNHSPDQGAHLQKAPPRPYLRYSIPQKSPNYSPAEAPTIRLDRKRSMNHAESISFQEIQNISGPIKNDSAGSPVFAATRERIVVVENPKNNVQKPADLPQSMSNKVLNPILPSKKEYMKNEASLGPQYVWHLRPLIDDNKFCSKSCNTDRGGMNIRRLSLSQNKYNGISNNEEFCVSDQNLLSSKEDRQFFGEDNFGFDFANMLPGLQMMEPFPMTRPTLSQNA